MNRNFRIISVLFLTAIYMNAVRIVNLYDNYSDFENTQISNIDKYFSKLSDGLASYATQSFYYLNNFNNERLPNCDNLFAGLWATQKLHEQIIASEITQYICLSKNILIKYRKSDNIFPFHYFW